MEGKKAFDFIQRYYLFIYEAKTTSGVYFLAFSVLYLFLGLAVPEKITIDLFTAIQMMIACFLIGFSQHIIIPYEKVTVKRAFIWMVFSIIVTFGFSLGFAWFVGFPKWCAVVFYTFMIWGFAMMWLAVKWYSEKENKKLNENLKAYQKRLL
jgi:hypothetical protein